MTTTPNEPVRDEDIETLPQASSGPGVGGDADGTDGGDADGTDGDSTDSVDGDSTDASDGGADADGTDA